MTHHHRRLAKGGSIVRSLVPRTAIAILWFHAFPAFAQEVAVGSFPEVKAFPGFLADGLAHQLSLSRVTDNREWLGAIGGSLPVIGARIGEGNIQGGVGATTFNRLIKTPGHITVYTIDYKVDFPLDVRYHKTVYRIAFGHLSSHYADDGIEILGLHSIGYVRDYMTFAVAEDLELLHSTAYVSADWNFHYEPIAKPWILQAGLQGGWFPLWDESATLYGAVDLKLRENLAWGTTQSYQIGVRCFPNGRFALRLSYTLRLGFEERGQLYDERVSLNLVGVTVEF